MITHELLKRPLTAQEATDLSEYMTAKVKTHETLIVKSGYFYLDQDNIPYFAYEGLEEVALWKIGNEAVHAPQAWWENNRGCTFRPLHTSAGRHLNYTMA